VSTRETKKIEKRKKDRKEKEGGNTPIYRNKITPMRRILEKGLKPWQASRARDPAHHNNIEVSH